MAQKILETALVLVLLWDSDFGLRLVKVARLTLERKRKGEIQFLHTQTDKHTICK